LRKLFLNLMFTLVMFSLLTLAYSCSDNPVVSSYDNLTINGRITFVDTTGYYKFTDTSKGYYDVSAFAVWPPMSNATASSKLSLKMENGKMVADYKLILPSAGDFTITSSWIKKPYTVGNSVFGLGKYKSDTSHSAALLWDTTGARVYLPSSPGVGGINFLSFIDTTKKLYRF